MTSRRSDRGWFVRRCTFAPSREHHAPWVVYTTRAIVQPDRHFPTHAEAIAYATTQARTEQEPCS